ncbi:MAG: 4-alpha-glucanotransferase [Pseudomonadales bacterium]|nr:4-alpha-glucanotransferase [Pseudomonadales bacterium]
MNDSASCDSDNSNSPLNERSCGILLHPSSLPGPLPLGGFGPNAYRFIDFLAQTGIRFWQMLPLVPPNQHFSPYQSHSAFAGNRHFISPLLLADTGLIKRTEALAVSDYTQLDALIDQAYLRLKKDKSNPLCDQFSLFKNQNDDWLEMFAFFELIKLQHPQPWTQWPAPLRDRDPQALEKWLKQYPLEFQRICFSQFIFFQQWDALKQYAHINNVQMIGDLSIFVDHDSADVWADPEQFRLDHQGNPHCVAGVPPDYFSDTGQYWGNPLYNWKHMELDGFQWWQRRIEHAIQLYDLVRIDHFRGFEACWEIPAHETTAINGHWDKSSGDALLQRLQQKYQPLPLIAEDLGVITEEVNQLRDKYNLPGMKILQFAFDSDDANPYLPHNHTVNSVVYTGTHDNNTTLGWFQSLDQAQKHRVLDYLGQPEQPMPWSLIETALGSVAKLVILPLQDLLGLDGDHRMNTPGRPEDNWKWRFHWSQISEQLKGQVKEMIERSGRTPTHLPEPTATDELIDTLD